MFTVAVIGGLLAAHFAITCLIAILYIHVNYVKPTMKSSKDKKAAELAQLTQIAVQAALQAQKANPMPKI